MKILYHHRTQGKTVEGVHIREVVKALRDLGHEVFIVSPPGIDPFNEIKNNVENEKKGLSYIWSFISRNVPQFVFELIEISYNITAYINIRKIIKKEKIDLIYERYAFFSIAGVFIANQYAIPFILEVNEVGGIKRQRSQFFTKLIKKFEKEIFNRAGIIFTVSGFLKNCMLQMNISPTKIYVVPNGVNIKEFNPAIDSSNVRKKLNIIGTISLGFVGSFSEWDKLEFLIESFSEMVKENDNLRLVLIGDGFNKKIQEENALKKGLNEKVIFTGRISRNEISSYIAAIDIFVIPHSNPFGSPVVLFEYMSMAKPVVGPDLIPIQEIIQNGINGNIFELGNKESLKKNIFSLVNDPQKRMVVGLKARETILSSHLWKHNAEKIINEYKKYINT